MMIEKYIIDKEDLPKLIRGEELPLSQGSKARAFKIEIIGNLTNGDLIKALFPNYVYPKDILMQTVVDNEKGYVLGEFYSVWWNKPYKEDRKEV